jgi:hypothetical protein
LPGRTRRRRKAPAKRQVEREQHPGRQRVPAGSPAQEHLS